MNNYSQAKQGMYTNNTQYNIVSTMQHIIVFVQE